MAHRPLSRFLPAAVAVALLPLLAAPARALSWSPYTSPLSNYSVAAAGAGSYHSPSVCPDGRGGIWVAYVDDDGFTAPEITVRRLSADGTGDYTRKLTSDAFDQDQPQVVASDSGGVYVVWRDNRNSATTGYDIYMQYVGPEGLVRWTANGVQVTNAAGTQQTPYVGHGFFGLIVAWLDDRNGAGNSDIYSGKVSYSGVVSSLAGSGVCTNAFDQVEFVGSPAADGLYLTWRDNRNGNYDVFGEWVASIGSNRWTAFGGTGDLCVAPGTQAGPRVVDDGFGSAYAAWQDLRGADYDIYLQRVANYGDLQYGTTGTLVCSATLNQTAPEIAPDGSGGAIVAWLDDRAAPRSIYAQRVAPSGAPLWTANGVDVASGITGTLADLRIVADGLGGAFVVWSEARAGQYDLYGQRLSSSGSPQWGSGGLLISGAYGNQSNASIAMGSENSLQLAWEDERQGVGDPSIYAQRVDRFGYLGDASPRLVDVSDVAGDQGGQVRLDWAPGYVEFDPHLQVTTYYVLRQVPATLAASLQRGGARLVSEPAEPAAGERVLLAQPSAIGVTYWEYVGQAPAFQADAYSYVAPTTSDSVAGVLASTQFMVQARNSSGSRYWFSNVKIGHSLDNLAPAAPAPFTGTYSGGASVLAWHPNTEQDLAGYRLYRGTSASFTPSQVNLVTTQPDTGYVDAPGTPYWYKLTAVDVHGNESPVATLLPAGTTAVEAGAGARAFFALGSANPVRAGVATTLRFGLATAGRASLALYDAGGRRVRELAAGTLEAGEHAIAWDGRDEAGRAAAPGLYFARFETLGFTATRKLVVQD